MNVVHLPEGTLTFLFTDIEGSTKLNQKHDTIMSSVLARHDQLIEDSVAQHDGSVVRPRGEGDSRFTVFQRATDAIASACDIQRKLGQEPWPQDLKIRVRMALHTGEADVINGDYRGTAVDRCARLRSVGHGGQVLISQTTYDLVRDVLPQGISLRDLGSHRLKDLGRPEQVFQLLHPDLPDQFPPLKSLGSLPNNLPIQANRFVGRESDLVKIQKRLEDSRLLTLTGPGGCGKTRLSLQVAAEVLEQYPDGAWFMELAGLSDPELVLPTVAAALNVREEAQRDLVQTLVDAIQPRTLLLVLDNCEHLIAACARLATTLLQVCPNVRILASSREPLNIAGETIWPVAPLPYPDPQRLPTLEQLTQYEAVRLFIDRAVALKPTFQVTNQNAPAVAQICYQLDGIALAIELAAARIKTLQTAEKIAERLNRRFRLLTGGSRTALPRQQTLEAAIAWSYDLLSESEKLIFQRLSIFIGGWTLEAAEVICADEALDEFEVLENLTLLVDKSLVTTEELDGDVRYRFLESIWRYSQQQALTDSDALVRQHWNWFLALAEEADTQLQGADQLAWLNRLEQERRNFRGALERSEEADPEIALKLVGSLWRFWYLRSYLREGRQWLTTVLNRPEPDALRSEWAKVLNGAGVLAYAQGDYDSAQSLHRQSLERRQALEDQRGMMDSFNNLGVVSERQGDFATAQSLYEQCLEIAQSLDDQDAIADALNNLGPLVWEQQPEQAQQYFEQSLAIRRSQGDRRGIADALNNLGVMAQENGDLDQAEVLMNESLEIVRQLGDRASIADGLNNLGVIACMKGEFEAARPRFEESLEIRCKLENQVGIAESLGNLGMVAKDMQDYTVAKSYFEQSLELRRQLGLRAEMADSLYELGCVTQAQGEVQMAETRYRESLELFRACEYTPGIEMCEAALSNLGESV
jgi:predicted ATPase/class 3 adenylate cyclase/Tfp pilus assembly protein PilF